VRWEHPTRGLVPPDTFIGLAEQAGLINDLTRWVLGEAIAEVGRWRADGAELSVAVNLSARDLLGARLVDEVAGLLLRHGVPGHALTLEVTESGVMTDLVHGVGVLRDLSTLGVRLSIDDFGTGYSSMARLHALPVDEVKIDRGFVRDLDDPAGRAIVVATVQLARAFGLETVAEGVEDLATYEALAALGCTIAQGYYLTRPLPAPALRAWLADREAATSRVWLAGA
jgi:EAL domain-containing protein (putative c-di-GMP-specific phosphodiesterase class I)